MVIYTLLEFTSI